MKAVIFDLDNTLFDVEQYFSGAFSDVADYLKEKYHLSSIEIYQKLMNIWKEKTSMYPRLFNDLLGELGLEEELEKVVQIFNEYEGELKPYSDTIPLLSMLNQTNFKLGLITDGNAHRQRRKINLLDIARFFDVIIFTTEIGQSKLTEVPFRKALHELKTSPEYSFYVGDNPYLDFKGAKQTGMKTVRLLKGEFKNIRKNEYIDYEINELKELLGFFDE
jgi:putative hydrolase of the HAD superfamily